MYLGDLTRDELIVLISRNFRWNDSMLIYAKYETLIKKAELLEKESESALRQHLNGMVDAQSELDASKRLEMMHTAVEYAVRYEAIERKAKRLRKRAEKMYHQWERTFQSENSNREN